MISQLFACLTKMRHAMILYAALWLAVQAWLTSATLSYTYIGCYYDNAGSRDLSGPSSAYAYNTLTALKCVSMCSSQGYAYAGLQEGATCYCGNLFNKYGQVSSAQLPVVCTNLCNNNTEYCGGKSANSIYYTLPTDQGSLSNRVSLVYTTPLKFDDARQTCVKKTGDLASATTTAAMTTLAALATKEGINNKIWLGARRRYDDSYQWSDYTVAFAANDYLSFWASPPSYTYDCVLMNVQAMTWQTANCDATVLPYICTEQQPDNSTTAVMGGASVSTSSSSSNLLALLIVLPIFAVCYGGSCVLYCVYKLYRSFKRTKKKKGLIDEEQPYIDEDFNTIHPETPPYFEPRKPNPVIKNFETKDEPATESEPVTAAPIVRPSSRVSSSRLSSKEVSVAVIGSNPAGVNNKDFAIDEVTLGSSPPTDEQYRASRKAMRKQLLLQRAIVESKERKTREGGGASTPVGNPSVAAKQSPTPWEPQQSDRSSFKSRRVSRASHYEVLEGGAKDKSKNSNGSESPGQNSNGSNRALIGDSKGRESVSSKDNPMEMSVTDIIRVKRMMKAKPNKRKIMGT